MDQASVLALLAELAASAEASDASIMSVDANWPFHLSGRHARGRVPLLDEVALELLDHVLVCDIVAEHVIR